jgi:hypothetical protein
MQRFSVPLGSLQPSDTNHQKVVRVHDIIDTLLDDMLVRGFYGVGKLKITVQDGTIQLIEDGIERKHR